MDNIHIIPLQNRCLPRNTKDTYKHIIYKLSNICQILVTRLQYTLSVTQAITRVNSIFRFLFQLYRIRAVP